MTQAPVASLRDVTFRYGALEVFADLSVDLPSGATFLVGVNGAGKTTMFRLLLGELAPAAGDVDVLSRPLRSKAARLAARDDVGHLPQHFGYPPRLTVLEFVSYVAWLRGVPRRRLAEAAARAIERVGLTDRAGVAMGALSGGMLRRAGIAQAIVAEPQLLLLDEPTVGLDPAQRVALRELITGLAADTSVIVSTHLLEDVRSAADTVVVLHDGGVRFTGTPTELAGTTDSSGDLERAFLALTSDRAVPA